MNEGTAVTGTYFGVPFTGIVDGVWTWNDKFGRDGADSIFVKLDKPIVVYGVERKLVCIKGEEPQTTLRPISE